MERDYPDPLRTQERGVSYENRNKNPMNHDKRNDTERASIAERVKDQDRQLEQQRRSEAHVKEFNRVRDQGREHENKLTDNCYWNRRASSD